jgi:hypothetical protein
MATDKNKANASTRPKNDPTHGGTIDPNEREFSPTSIAGIRAHTLNHISVKLIMFLLIIIFAAGFLVTSFNPTAGINTQQNQQQRLQSTEAVARVGNDSIERGRLETIAARQDAMMEQFGQKTGPLEYLGSRQRTLQQLANNAALVQAARDAGLTVSAEEIKAETDKRIAQQIESEKKQSGEANFRRQIEAQYGSLDAYKSELQQLAAKEQDGMEKALLSDKLQKKIEAENKVTEDDYKKNQTKLKLWQIVVRPKMAGFADKNAQEKNKSEAKVKAEKLAASLKKNPSPQNFSVTAKKESDDLTTKSKGGDVGWKLPVELPLAPEIRDAVVKSSGQIVGPIADPNSGDQYIFLVEIRQLKLPKDYAKNKAKLLKDFETQKDSEAWQKYQTEIGKAAKVEVLDPALLAYKTQTEEIYAAPADKQAALRQDALQKYESALPSAGGMESAAIRYQMAMLYRDLKEPKKAAEVLKAATEEVKDNPQLQLEYATALRDAGDKKGALDALQATSKSLDNAPPASPSMFGGNPNDALHYQLAAHYELLGRKDLAAAERKKVAPSSSPGGMGMPGMSLGNSGKIVIPPRR